jgi:hypothetical protein
MEKIDTELLPDQVLEEGKERSLPELDCLVVCQFGRGRSPESVGVLREEFGLNAASIGGGLDKLGTLSGPSLEKLAEMVSTIPIFVILTEGEERHRQDLLKRLEKHHLNMTIVRSFAGIVEALVSEP